MFCTSNSLLDHRFLAHVSPKAIIDWGHQHRLEGKKTMDLVNTQEYLRHFTFDHWQALAQAIKVSEVEAVNMGCNYLGYASDTQWDYLCKSFEGIGQIVKAMSFSSNDFERLKPEQLRKFKPVITGLAICCFRHNKLGNFSSEQLNAWGEALQNIQAIDLSATSFHKFSKTNMEKLGNIFKKSGTKSINIFDNEFAQKNMTNVIWESFCNMLTHTFITDVLAERCFPYDDDQSKIDRDLYIDLYRDQPNRIQKILDTNKIKIEKIKACLAFLSGKNDINASTPLFQFFKGDAKYKLTKNILQYAELPIPESLCKN